MVDNTVTVAVWLVVIVGGGSLWLNAIARDRGPNGAPGAGARADRPAPRSDAPPTAEPSSAAPASVSLVRSDRER